MTRLRQKTTGAPRLWFNSSSNLIEIHAHSTHTQRLYIALLPSTSHNIDSLYIRALFPGAPARLLIIIPGRASEYKEPHIRKPAETAIKSISRKNLYYIPPCVHVDMVYTWYWGLLRIKCACESSAGLGCGLHTREPINSVTDGQKIFPFFLSGAARHTHKQHAKRNKSQPIYLF